MALIKRTSEKSNSRPSQDYLVEGHFKGRQHGLKVEAALGFVDGGGDHAIITSLIKL